MNPRPWVEVLPAAWPPQATASVPHLDPHVGVLSRMADGDQDAAAALHAACYGPLLRIACLIVRERSDADEVVNDTFAQAWRDSASFDGTRSSVAGWLTMIVRSRARDCVRARTRRELAQDRLERCTPVCIDGIQGHRSGQHALCVVELGERDALLARVLRQLSNEQREAIEMVFLRECPHGTAAERLGVPLGTLKTRVRLGLRRMRVLLDQSGVTRSSH
jgi:RNA polymerase sigma-70 factor (ECF subfamily)